MTNDTNLSDLTVGEFKALMRECLQQDMDAAKEVERLRGAFHDPLHPTRNWQPRPSPYEVAMYKSDATSLWWPFD